MCALAASPYYGDNAAPSTDLARPAPPRGLTRPSLGVPMRRLTVFSLAALLFAGSTALAQTKPSFAGKWTIIPDTGASAQQQGMPRGGAAMGGLAEEALITQDDSLLTISRQLTVGPVKSVFNLKGTETRQSLAIGNGNMVDLTLKAKWEGAKLLT